MDGRTGAGHDNSTGPDGTGDAPHGSVHYRPGHSRRKHGRRLARQRRNVAGCNFGRGHNYRPGNRPRTDFARNRLRPAQRPVPPHPALLLRQSGPHADRSADDACVQRCRCCPHVFERRPGAPAENRADGGRQPRHDARNRLAAKPGYGRHAGDFWRSDFMAPTRCWPSLHNRPGETGQTEYSGAGKPGRRACCQGLCTRTT